MNFIKDYLAKLSKTLDSLPLHRIGEIKEILWRAYQENKQIFILGNGGSAATASHFACDLAKGTICSSKRRFRVISLVDNIPLMTAWSNDISYNNLFAEQLANLINEGDVVIGISGSGNSQNVLNALKLAKSYAAITIGFTGFQGGKLKDIADVCLIVPSDCMERIEDVHLILEHLICLWLREEIRNCEENKFEKKIKSVSQRI
jgi:D-sedoheptulose 7-phosphate isomerase